jgi:hypothetical protein
MFLEAWLNAGEFWKHASAFLPSDLHPARAPGQCGTDLRRHEILKRHDPSGQSLHPRP